MNKQMIEAQWGYLRMVLGNARKQVELIPEDKLNFRPVPPVRTASELCVHMFTYLTESTETVLTGKNTQRDEMKFSKKADLLKWIDGQIEKGYANLAKITDAQLAAKIDAWGQPFEGWKMVGFVFDEVLHHRGQLTVYLRLMGVQPAFIYDFE
ncbi:MAG: DinB family protein [bacterium]|nr:DinB family protein [bacterium]